MKAASPTSGLSNTPAISKTTSPVSPLSACARARPSCAASVMPARPRPSQRVNAVDAVARGVPDVQDLAPQENAGPSVQIDDAITEPAVRQDLDRDGSGRDVEQLADRAAPVADDLGEAVAGESPRPARCASRNSNADTPSDRLRR